MMCEKKKIREIGDKKYLRFWSVNSAAPAGFAGLLAANCFDVLTINLTVGLNMLPLASNTGD